MRVLILSGVPGSGKSTYIAVVVRTKRAVICSADSYFSRDGSYKFDPSLLGKAHGECIKNFIACIDSKEIDVLIVDNTNTSDIEMAPYVAIAAAHGVAVDLVTLLVSPSVAHQRNLHGVSLGACSAMDRRIRARQLPPFWDITQTTIGV